MISVLESNTNAVFLHVTMSIANGREWVVSSSEPAA
jgi:hypothetical protein